jgi:hypothetical protein
MFATKLRISIVNKLPIYDVKSQQTTAIALFFAFYVSKSCVRS